MTIRQILMQASLRLEKAGVPDPDFDARELISYALGVEKSELFLKYSDEMPSDKELLLESLLEKREARIPLQRIMGKTWFMGLEILVFDDVLIPRSDTETLAEKAIEAIRSRGYQTALDLCCGSGAIAVAIKKYAQNCQVTASDICEKCIYAAKKNALHNEVCVETALGDMFLAVGNEKFDLIACNPPYIDISELDSLQDEVRLHDPHAALFAENKGYFFYEYLKKHAKDHINKGGMLLMEVGIGQAEKTAKLFEGQKTYIIKDLNAVDRVVCVEF